LISASVIFYNIKVLNKLLFKSYKSIGNWGYYMNKKLIDLEFERIELEKLFFQYIEKKLTFDNEIISNVMIKITESKIKKIKEEINKEESKSYGSYQKRLQMFLEKIESLFNSDSETILLDLENYIFLEKLGKSQHPYFSRNEICYFWKGKMVFISN